MPFDFSNLQPPPPAAVAVDPISLFRSLQVRDNTINDLWMGQADALREWHGHRAASDISIILNTGAGKTLVGLLLAQSLVNETRGHVVYVCASIQLVQQTASKGDAYGLPVTTYFERRFSDTRYQECKAPCVTTYQALFNGLTRKWNDVDAIIFDDAHTATHIIRDQFTLKIDRDRHPEAYAAIQTAFSEHIRATGSDIGLQQAMDRRDQTALWFVPPFVVRSNFGEIGRAMRAAGLDQDANEMFGWGYLKDKLDLCAVFLTTNQAFFTPPVVPVRALSYFRKGIRRVYMSATLGASDVFLRTFGKLADHTIAPDTTAGQCERMVLVPAKAPGVTDDVATGKQVVATKKALILVPTHREGASWEDVLTERIGDDVATQVDQFKGANPPAKLRLVARYDGVDLPGDTCRVMVIHGLPSGLGALERFMWESLRIRSVLRTTVASRVVQSFGRISRGMTDHGVIVLTGQHLIDWLLVPANREALPRFLRRQIEVGFALSEQVDPQDLPGVAQQCLDRSPGWTTHYGRAMAGVVHGLEDAASADMVKAAEVEAQFGLQFWERDFDVASATIHNGRDALFRVGSSLAAWYILWSGYAHELLNYSDEAHQLYGEARGVEKDLPVPARPLQEMQGEVQRPDQEQIEELARLVLTNPKHLVAKYDRELAALPGGTVAQQEEAVRCLGTYLGLRSSRPDNDERTGPDVLWYLRGKTAWSLELKTDKVNDQYAKKEVMQATDHVQWVRDNHDVGAIVPFIVGPVIPAHPAANPIPDLTVMDPAYLVELRDLTRAALVDVLTDLLPVTARAQVAKVFGARGLLWSQLAVLGIGVKLRSIPDS